MPPLLYYVAVPGTWGWSDDWYTTGYWTRMMQDQGFVQFKRGGRHYRWSTDLNGWQFWRRWFGFRPNFRDWEASGYSFYDHVDGHLTPEDTNIFCHSFGLMPVLIACALGLKVNVLTSIMAPPRTDVKIEVNGQLIDVCAAARPNISFWQCLYSDHTDRWALRGLVGNGQLDMDDPHVRRHPWALRGGRGVTRYFPGVSHSRMLRELELMHLWRPVLETVRLEASQYSTPYR